MMDSMDSVGATTSRTRRVHTDDQRSSISRPLPERAVRGNQKLMRNSTEKNRTEMPPKKGQKMDLGAFLSNDGGSWNDDVDLPSAPASTFDANALPTGPKGTGEYSSMAGSGGGYGQSRASGGTFDPASVPFDGPFTAFIGNLSYDVTEHELETFFGSEIRIKSVRFIMDIATNRPKGYGYVEFLDRDSLIGAVQMDGESLQKRSVRINVAEQKARPGRSGGFEDSKFQGNWRTKAAEQPPRQTNPFGGNRRDDGERPPHAGGWAAGFQRRDESRPFQRREPAAVAAPAEPVQPREPKEPKENPFGNAAPRDEEAIQKQIEERRLAREKERAAAAAKEKAGKERAEKEKVAAAEEAMENAKLSDRNAQKSKQREVVPDNVPSGAGSWRRPSGAAKPTQKPSFRRSEKGSIASIPGEPAAPSSGGGAFSKFNGNKKDGKKPTSTAKKEYVRRDKDGPSPTSSSTKSDVKSPTNAFELLTED